MDRKTLLAVVLSVVIIVGGMLITPLLFPSKTAPLPPAGSTAVASPTTPSSGQTSEGSTGTTAQGTTPTAAQATTTVPAVAGPGIVAATPDSAPPASQPETIERQTDLYDLTFSSAGATLTSVKLRKYSNVDKSLVDMVMLPKSPAANEIPFGISFGAHGADELTVPFVLHESSNGAQSVFDFSRVFVSSTGIPFTLRKTYAFDKDEYLFELRVSIENSVNDFPALDFNGFAYTLTLGPQIGPHYLKLDNRNDYRNYAYYDGKRQDPRVGLGQMKELDKQVRWTGIVGKYFTAIAVPDATTYRIVYDSRKLVESFDRSTISFERPVVKSAKSTDVFRFYMGPMKKEILSLYNDASKNQFGVSDLHADEVVPTAAIVGWLATLMKYVLDFCYLLIPNYGVAIILLTLLTKVVFLPLTFRSSESMARMAALNPKMAEIRTQYKDKPEKMNQAIAELYKREKVNPLSGCLPLLLQLPVFIALYNLLNSHFELRGALFIPGWIPDLSAPESVWTFPSAVPLLGTGLHLLPIIMLATQIASSKFTQPTGGTQQGGAQAKLLMYAMPIVFFFILYEMPSGLVLYWTVQNVLSVAQQLYINWLRAKKNGSAGQGPAQPVLAGKGGRNAPAVTAVPGGKNGARPVLKPNR